jgi:hypothetical protein
MKIPNRVDVNNIDWDKFRYEVFDVPTHPGLYQDRYSFLGKI